MVRRYLLPAVQFILLLSVLAVSFGLLLADKLTTFVANHYQMVAWTDPAGAAEIFGGISRTTHWITSKLRIPLAKYVRSFHPDVWRRLRDYLHPRG
ncbi:MAG: hypothetical protein V5A83_02475 [Candidatus Bipolaricaulota bacterium]|nr:hypothetical protein [Candidatus Bipolaricaulota bacterium]